jgi:hypothetical protein
VSALAWMKERLGGTPPPATAESDVPAAPEKDETDTEAVRWARAKLAVGCWESSYDQTKARELMERAGNLERKVLQAIFAELDTRSANAATEASAGASQAAHEERRQHRLRRPQRWAALSPLERAAYLIAHLKPVAPLVAADLLRFAKLATLDPASFDVPSAFEEGE